jgi:predicted dehydrogenase
MDKIRWGIVGTGRIAQKFAEGLTRTQDAELVAIGSRAKHTADGFGDKWKVRHRHAAYEALAADPEVDVVYVATPHPMHKESSILCLRAGKAVLCEKPLAVNAREAQEVIACARERRLFLMEAMWARFLPVQVRLREMLAAGAIGEPRMITAAFCFRSGWDPAGRLLSPALAGGGLLDVGVYTVSLASMVFGGPPADVAAMAHIGETGVDEQSAILLRYDAGRLAALTCAIRTFLPHEAVVAGTEGYVRLPHPFWKTDRLFLGRDPGAEELVKLPYAGNGYQCEAEEVQRCLRAGKLESDVMPLSETLSVMQTLDRIRAQWGLTYPME